MPQIRFPKIVMQHLLHAVRLHGGQKSREDTVVKAEVLQAYTAAQKILYEKDVATASKDRTGGKDDGHLYDHYVYNQDCHDCRDANQQSDRYKKGGSASIISPDRILYVDFVGKRLPKAMAVQGPHMPFNGATWAIIGGRYLGGPEEGSAILWVDALKTRTDDDVVVFLQDAIYELGLQGTGLWYLHSDRAPELKSKKVRRFLLREQGLPLRGVSNRSTSHAREEALVKRAVRGGRVLMRAAGVGFKFWPHAFRTFAVNTNLRRREHGLKRNNVPMRVFGHRGTAVLPDTSKQKDFAGKVTTKVMFLSPVVETAGAVWVYTADGQVRDVFDRDVSWEATFVHSRTDRGLEEIIEELQDPEEWEEPVVELDSSSDESEDGDALCATALSILGREPAASELGSRVAPEPACAFLTETVTRKKLKDFDHLDWVAAREKEAAVIEQFGVFGPTEEEDDVRERVPTATTLPVMEVCAVKHREKAKSEQIPRVRIVLDGGNERGIVDRNIVKHVPDQAIQTANPREVRTALTVGKRFKRKGKKADVKGAYLNTECVTEAFGRLPAWLRQRLFPDGKHWKKPLNKLLKMLYGKTDSGFEWDTLLSTLLMEAGWERNLASSASVWTRMSASTSELETLIMYVDDLLFIALDSHAESHAELVSLIPVGELEELNDGNFVGCRYHDTSEGIVCDQTELTATMIGRFDEDYTRLNCKIKVRKHEVPAIDMDSVRPGAEDTTSGLFKDVAARHVMGLMYVARHSRPDLSQAIGALARRMSSWSATDDKALVRLFEYTRSTQDFVLLLRHVDGVEPNFVCFTDADFAGDRDSRKSTSGWVFGYEYPDGTFCPMDWASCRQKVVALSTAEAELRACLDGSREFIGSFPLLAQLQASKQENGTVWVDSQACIDIAKKGRSNKLRYVAAERKSVQVNLHWIHTVVSDMIQKVHTDDNVADIFTKPLSTEAFNRHRDRLGVMKYDDIGNHL